MISYDVNCMSARKFGHIRPRLKNCTNLSRRTPFSPVQMGDIAAPNSPATSSAHFSPQLLESATQLLTEDPHPFPRQEELRPSRPSTGLPLVRVHVACDQAARPG